MSAGIVRTLLLMRQNYSFFSRLFAFFSSFSLTKLERCVKVVRYGRSLECAGT